MPPVRLRDISLSYGEPVLADISFDVERGEFVSIIGPSGCGKSTLFNVIAGLERRYTGTSCVDRGTAYMPQGDLLLPWRTILANTSLGLEIQGVRKPEARRRAGELFGPFGLAGFENAWPRQLSGGMRQRAAMLRTVVQDREVLLLDEPLGALDALTRREVQEWLERVWARYRWTVLMVTHDVREAVLLSDRVLVLSPRPARLVADVCVDIARPRSLGLTTTRLERRLLRHLEHSR